jgi:hypothetical protein
MEGMVTREPPDINAGTIEVGQNDNFEVIINFNLKDFLFDKNGFGHLVFSPRQARYLANLLMKHAAEALLAWRAKEDRSAKS